jgi:hypothetical protein
MDRVVQDVNIHSLIHSLFASCLVPYYAVTTVMVTGNG